MLASRLLVSLALLSVFAVLALTHASGWVKQAKPESAEPISFSEYCRIQVGAGAVAEIDANGALLGAPHVPEEGTVPERIREVFKSLADRHPSAESASRCKRPTWLRALSGVKWSVVETRTPSADFVSGFLVNPDLLRTEWPSGEGFPDIE